MRIRFLDRLSRRTRLALAWIAGIALCGGLGFLVYVQLIEGAWIRYNKWDRRERGALRAGDQAPDMELPMLGEGKARLSEMWRSQPVVLIFGSCT